MKFYTDLLMTSTSEYDHGRYYFGPKERSMNIIITFIIVFHHVISNEPLNTNAKVLITTSTEVHNII